MSSRLEQRQFKPVSNPERICSRMKAYRTDVT